MTTHVMMRLGLALTGTNEDLELEPPENSSGSGEGSEEEESPSEEEEEGEDGEGSSDGEDSEDSEDDAKGSSDEDEEDSEDSSSDGDDSEDEEGEDGDPLDFEDSEDGEEPEDGDGEPEENPDGSTGTGGAGEDPDKDFEGIAQELLEAMLNGEGTDLLDLSEALQEAIVEETDAGKDCRYDEAVWRPYEPSADRVEMVKGGNIVVATALKAGVKKEISYLRAQLRTKFLQARRPGSIHGVRKGRELSERRIVNSVVELRSGKRPSRPDWKKKNKEACTLAAAVIIDESGSMGAKLAARASAAALSIAIPLDELGSPCLVVGPRSGGGYSADTTDYSTNPERYHRIASVLIDVFKDWDEPMRAALPRFSQVRSTGGTPLSDGIQYALTQLNERDERFRVVFVITDGRPNCESVVRRQIRLAAEAGVFVVGVGISDGCDAVRTLFPVHVAVHDLKELPREMMSILGGIMFPTKGRRITLDGKFGGQRA